MSIAYAAPVATPGAPVSGLVTFTWSASALLGSMVSLLHGGSDGLTDAVGISTWTAAGLGTIPDGDYVGPSGASTHTTAGSNTPPSATLVESATDGDGAIFFPCENGAVGANRANLYSQSLSAFNPGDADWTVEFFAANAQPRTGQSANFGSSTPILFFIANATAVNSLYVRRSGFPSFGGLMFAAIDDLTTITSSEPLVHGAWHHFALSRKGGDIQFFVDGVLAGEVAHSVFSAAARLSLGWPQIGIESVPGFGGWIDEFRYTHGHTVYWDDTYGVPQHDLTGFSQGYIIYRDGAPIGTTDALDGLSFSDPSVVGGQTYEYQVGAWDGVMLVSDLSDPIEITVASEQFVPLVGFNDELISAGYFGGKLRGTTVACVGDNANKVKSCC